MHKFLGSKILSMRKKIIQEHTHHITIGKMRVSSLTKTFFRKSMFSYSFILCAFWRTFCACTKVHFFQQKKPYANFNSVVKSFMSSQYNKLEYFLQSVHFRSTFFSIMDIFTKCTQKNFRKKLISIFNCSKFPSYRTVVL